MHLARMLRDRLDLVFPEDDHGSRGGAVLQAALLLGLFAVTFSIPVILVPKIRDSLRTPVGVDEGTESSNDDFFTQATTFPNGSERGLELRGAASELTPIEGKDFLFTSWYKLRRVPGVGERIVLFRKVDPQTEGGPGYALAIFGHSDGIEPAILWRDGTKRGRWYYFSNLKLAPRQWFMLALSLHEGHYLGLHAIVRSSDGAGPAPITLLGGYDVEGLGLPNSALGPTFNPGGQPRALGRLGAFGFFVLPGLQNRLKEYLEDFSADPFSVPSDLERRTLYWSNGRGAISGSLQIEQVVSQSSTDKRASR